MGISESVRRSGFIAGQIGLGRSIGKTGKSFRSDAGELDYSQFDKMMKGTPQPADRACVTRRNHLDKVLVVKTGASLLDQLFGGAYAYEFHTKRGELLGGMRYLLADVWKTIEVDIANPPKAKLTDNAIRATVLIGQPDLTGEALKQAMADFVKPKPSVWKRKRISLETVPFDKWAKRDPISGKRLPLVAGQDFNLGPLRMFFAAQVRDDMKIKCGQAWKGHNVREARAEMKARRRA